jgi:hypothetical protein
MYVLGGSRTSDGKRAGPSIYELNAGGEGRSAREIPRLVAAGLAITWHAGRRELVTMAALEVLSGVGVAAEVVVGRRVLEAILATQHTNAGLAGVWPSAAIDDFLAFTEHARLARNHGNLRRRGVSLLRSAQLRRRR